MAERNLFDNFEVRGPTGLVLLHTDHHARLGSNDSAAAILKELVTREPRFAEAAQHNRNLAPLLPGGVP